MAAGRSTRMKSSRSKVVTPILGKPVILYLLDALHGAGFAAEDIILVVSSDHEDVKAVVNRPVRYVVQDPPLGTGHALKVSLSQLHGFTGDLLVTVGDNPYIQAADLQTLMAVHERDGAACTLLSAVFPGTPPPYGRLIRDADGNVVRVVEELDATGEERTIREVNASIYLFDFGRVAAGIDRIGNQNKKKEYYLTDIIGILNGQGQVIRAVPAQDHRVSIGVNNKWELTEAASFLNLQNMRRLSVEKGVLFLQPESTTVEMDVTIGEDTVIHPCTILTGGVEVGRNCQIGPFVSLHGGKVEDGQVITGSQP